MQGIEIKNNCLERRFLKNLEETGVAGFEPTNDGVKVRRLTTWRYPKIGQS